MQLRRDGSDDDNRQRRNAYCAHRALKRTINRVNLGRDVSLFYTKKVQEVVEAFPAVFTPKGQEELDLYYGEYRTKSQQKPSDTTP